MTNSEAIGQFKSRLEIKDYQDKIPEYYQAMELAVKALENQSKLEEQIVRELKNLIELIVEKYPFQGRYVKKNVAIDIVREAFKESEVPHE